MNPVIPVVVVETGAANIASVCAALKRCGSAPSISSSLEEISAARRLVLPGVGAFGSVMNRLDELGLIDEIRRRVVSGRHTLAICLGLQVLATGSEESPNVPGIGVISDTVTRFGSGIRVPQLGWNQVTAGKRCSLLKDGAAYFANSYRLEAVPQDWQGATANHGGQFVAGIERGAVLACQFHPELSARWGQELLQRWLAARAITPC